ncbi:MAG: HAMP domain-containing protein [Nitrospirae bacterium]|nr:HAMP domain-containing protein [Nitrospirota bacterium]
MIVIIYMTASRQTKDMVKEIAISSEDISHMIYAGIKSPYPMSTGDREVIQRRLSNIREEWKDIEIFICDLDQKIAYATHEERINSKVADFISSKTVLQALDGSLKTGKEPVRVFEEEVHGKRYIITAHPILNHMECYHCHGSSRKVLGGMVVRKSADRSYAAIAELRNRNIMVTILGVCAVVVLIYIILSKLVRQPLMDFTSKIKELTMRIPEGDYSMRIDIRRPDEIGNLVASFNQMAETLEEKNNLLRRVYKELADANKELEAFSYSVSHDLKAPLRGIDGFSKMLMEEYSVQINERGTHYLNRIRENIGRMSALIDDMLTLSRAGMIELQPRHVKFSDMLNNVLEDFRGEIESRGISIKIGDLPIIRCDSTLMQTVFSNIISNAIKFTREKEKPEIIIGFNEGNDTIFVRDNGIGFDMQYHDKIFQVFQKLHLPEEYEGTGVGLALVKRIVDRHHGKVWAESEPGKGATFFVKLPIEK